MAGLIFILIYSLLLFVALRIIKDYFSRFAVIIFCCYWGISMAISSFQLYSFFEVSFTTYIMLLIGSSMFIIGMCLPKLKNVKKNNNLYKLDCQLSNLVNNKFIIIALLLIALYMLRYLLNALVLAEVDTHYITEDREENMFEGNKYAYLYSLYLLKPVTLYIFSIFSYSLIRKIHINIVSLTVYIFILVENCIIAGGRSIFLIFVIFFISFYRILHPKLPKLKIKNFLIIGVTIMIFLIGMVYMNSYRKNGKFEYDSTAIAEPFELFVKYSTLPMVLLDYSIKEDYVERLGGFQYGRASFLGIDNYIQPIKKRFGMDAESGYYIVNYLQFKWVSCSPTDSYNYAYTAIFYHYLDFGWFGVILIPLFLGLIFRFIIIRYYYKQSFPWLILIGICMYMMCNSVFSNALIKQDYWFFIGVLFVFDFLSWNKFTLFKSKLRFHDA